MCLVLVTETHNVFPYYMERRRLLFVDSLTFSRRVYLISTYLYLCLWRVGLCFALGVVTFLWTRRPGARELFLIYLCESFNG